MDGYFILDNKLKEEIYYLTGYSSWMKNFGVEELFCKKFLIQEETNDGIHIIVASDKKEYFPGDSIFLLVHCYDNYNREIEDVNFSYRFISGKKELQKGKGITSALSKDQISLAIPYGIKELPEIRIRSTYKLENLDTTYSLPVNYFADIEFYPEGGHCINGMKSNIAFKAVTLKGKSLKIEGDIVNQEGKVLTSIKSDYEGMGDFLYIPVKDESYYLQIKNPYGFNQKYQLPEGQDNGWQLNVRQNSKKILADINHSYGNYKIALITLSVRGYLSYYKVLAVRKNQGLVIPIKDLPEGVGVITLFDEKMLPQAERLVYINHSEDYDVQIHTDHISYLPRDSVTLNINISSGSTLHKGSYSLSVFDDFLCSSETLDEPDIRTSFLLSPEIKGEINNINEYLNFKDKNAMWNLDLLLLTQGWRDYRFIDKTDPSDIIIPKNMDDVFLSLMKPRFGRESVTTNGQLIVYFGGGSYRLAVDKDKLFSFSPYYSPENNTDMFLSAKDHNGSDKVSIVLENTKFEEDLKNYLRYLTDSLGRKTEVLIHNYNSFNDHFSYGIENHHWLEEVVIRRIIKKEEFSLSDLAFSKRTATHDQLDAAIDMEHLSELVYAPNFRNSPVFYVIDGILESKLITSESGAPMQVPDYTWVRNMDPRNIQEYVVIRGPEAQALYGYGIEYVIEIKTKALKDIQTNKLWINPIIIDKFDITKEFYKPKYDTEFKRSNTFPDLRKTIHWEPKLEIDENGMATVQFYNGDRYTRIKCILEGITYDGIPIHGEHSFEVSFLKE